MKEIYVGNLPFSVTEADLRTQFGQIGEIVNLKLISDKFTGKSKGFGFIEYANKEDAEKAVSAFDGKDFQGRNIRVNISKPKTDTGGGGRGGNGSRGGFRSNNNSNRDGGRPQRRSYEEN